MGKSELFSEDVLYLVRRVRGHTIVAETTLMQTARLASSPNSLSGKRLRHLSHPFYAILAR